MAAGGGCVGLTKPVENERDKLWLDSLTGVNHADFEMGVYPFQHHLDAPAFGGELHRIREQIPQYLLQTVNVAADDDAVQRVNDRLQSNAFGIGGRASGLDCGLDDGREIESLHVQADLPRYNPA